MKKIVLKVAIEDEKSKRKAFKVVAGIGGVDSVDVDMNEKKITVLGNADPVIVTAKLRKFWKFCSTELLSVEEKKEEKKTQTAEKEEKKPEVRYESYIYTPVEYSFLSDENPDACTIS